MAKTMTSEDETLAFMRRHLGEVTRDDYIAFVYGDDNVPSPWTAEAESELPQEFQDWSRFEVSDFNPYHAPAGTSEGGQFTSGPGGGAQFHVEPHPSGGYQVIRTTEKGDMVWAAPFNTKEEAQAEADLAQKKQPVPSWEKATPAKEFHPVPAYGATKGYGIESSDFEGTKYYVVTKLSASGSGKYEPLKTFSTLEQAQTYITKATSGEPEPQYKMTQEEFGNLIYKSMQKEQAEKQASEEAAKTGGYVVAPPSTHIPTWQVYKEGKIQGHFTTEGGAQGYVGEAVKADAVAKAAKEAAAKAAEAKAAESLARPLPAGVAPDPRVIDVGGDEWNKQTALRLEREYQAVKPKLEATMVAAAAAGSSATVKLPPAGKWEDLTGTEKDDTEQQWKNAYADTEYENEVHNWEESGQALADAKSILASKGTKAKPGEDWAYYALVHLQSERDKAGAEPLPDKSNILEQVNIDYNDQKGDGSGDPTISFDESLTLKQEMGDAIKEALTKAFNEAADKQVKYGTLEPPDYLHDNVKDTLNQTWDNMSEEGKFMYAQGYGYGDSQPDATPAPDPVVWPLPTIATEGPPLPVEAEKRAAQHGDPLNLTSGEVYRATQRAAKYLSNERAVQLLAERGLIKPEEMDGARALVADIDHKLWRDWVDSSTSGGGQLIQVATADELGGRLREARDINPMRAVPAANKQFKDIGGYEGIKALMRAKWETTQFLLDTADVPELQLFRAVNIPGIDKEKAVEVTDINHWQKFMKLPDAKIVRNGAASTSVSSSVSNAWDGSHGRVVLRASVPRTAALSIPPYGENTAAEREVVIAGTAWKKWDAYKGTAPEFSTIGIGGGTPTGSETPKFLPIKIGNVDIVEGGDGTFHILKNGKFHTAYTNLGIAKKQAQLLAFQ